MPSKLEQLQLQFRQRLKEERMIKIHTDSQQKALSKVGKYNGVLNGQSSITTPKPQPSIAPPQPHHSPIKKGSPGVDRSRPLPPISKEPRSTSSSSISPIGTSTETTIKTTVTTVSSRSRSVDLEPRQPSPKPVQNGNRMPVKNGLAKSVHPESQKPQNTLPDKKPDQDILSKVKQAELQRLKGTSKFREEVPARNGFTGAISKTSTEQKKTTRPAAPPSRPKPKPQATVAATARRAAPTVSKPNTRNVQPSTGKATTTAAVPRKPPGPGQAQCGVCGRNFNEDRIGKHTTVCKKAASKKVKVFDATKMRVKGTEAEQFVKKGLPKTVPKPKKSDWRKKHNDFIEAIRQAKMVQQHLAKGGKVSDLPPPPRSDTSDYVPCPHCGRKFNESVAERHIPKCKDILSNKKRPVPPRRK